MAYYPFVSVLLDRTGPPYTYKNHVEDLVPGDHVFVMLPRGTVALGLVKDMLVADLQGKATKWIIGKAEIDFTKWEALTALDPPPSKTKR